MRIIDVYPTWQHDPRLVAERGWDHERDEDEGADVRHLAG